MTTAPKAQKKFPLVPVIVGVVAVALIAVVVLTVDDGGNGVELGSPTITGDLLPRLPEGGADPAIGLPAPEVEGTDFDGEPVSITDDGRAKVIVFLAHWCPACQHEVPIVQDWLDGTTLPENVDFYSVATGITSARDNYPPSAWLDREGWTPPVLVDDEASRVGTAFGLSRYPFWVFTSADGTVLARITGGIAPSDLDNAVATLQAQAGG